MSLRPPKIWTPERVAIHQQMTLDQAGVPAIADRLGLKVSQVMSHRRELRRLRSQCPERVSPGEPQMLKSDEKPLWGGDFALTVGVVDRLLRRLVKVHGSPRP